MVEAMRTPPQALRVAIYCRVSSAGQEDNSSLQTQEERCREYAHERGWVVTGVFREVHTGVELFERPQLQLLRERVRSRDVDIVLAFALDRISRSQAHLGFLISELDHLGIRLALVTEELADTPEGRLLQSVRGFVAEMERLKIAERTSRGVRARVTSGRPIPGHKAPYGYAWKDASRSNYVVNPDEQPIVRRIYESLLAGSTLRRTAQLLTEEGIPTPTGHTNRWEVSTLRIILKNPVYTGHPVAYRTSVKRVNGKPSVRYRPASEWVSLPDNIAAAIVTDDEFAAVQLQLARNRATSARRNPSPEATLLRCGIGRCGYCNHPLQAISRRGKPHMYRCHPVGRERHGCPSYSVMAHILDGAVWQRVEEVLLDPEIIAMEVQRRQGTDPFTNDLVSFDRRLKSIEARRQRLARAIANLDDEDASAPLLAELRQLSTEARQLSDERYVLAAQAKARELDTRMLVSLKTWCGRVAKNLQTLSYKEKRLILEALGVSVKVFRVDHDPRWEILLAPLPIKASEANPFVFSTERDG